MGYLLTEIVVYLVIAGLIGFAFGWAVKAGILKKRTNKNIKETVKVKETFADVTPETIIEEVIINSTKPTLFTEVPVEGQDKLSSIKGIGPVIEKRLNQLGIYTFEQISLWTSEEELWITTQLAFPKSISKEEWVKQAKELLNK
jgi:predicted flap endonuclease-1-like 5' DNA nuclease